MNILLTNAEIHTFSYYRASKCWMRAHIVTTNWAIRGPSSVVYPRDTRLWTERLHDVNRKKKKYVVLFSEFAACLVSALHVCSTHCTLAPCQTGTHYTTQSLRFCLHLKLQYFPYELIYIQYNERHGVCWRERRHVIQEDQRCWWEGKKGSGHETTQGKLEEGNANINRRPRSTVWSAGNFGKVWPPWM